jgi:hypothetical protein
MFWFGSVTNGESCSSYANLSDLNLQKKIGGQEGAVSYFWIQEFKPVLENQRKSWKRFRPACQLLCATTCARISAAWPGSSLCRTRHIFAHSAPPLSRGFNAAPTTCAFTPITIPLPRSHSMPHACLTPLPSARCSSDESIVGIQRQWVLRVPHDSSCLWSSSTIPHPSPLCFV